MVLSLCACGETGNNDATNGSGATKDTTGSESTGVFMAVFGYGDITPTESVPLQGYGNHASRMSTGILSYMYALSLVVCDGEGNTAVLMSIDSAVIGTSLCQRLCDNIEKKTGIPTENILITSIHQHSTPDPACDGVPSSASYKDMFIKNATKGVQDALEDLPPL